jgi:hypothetical protein
MCVDSIKQNKQLQHVRSEHPLSIQNVGITTTMKVPKGISERLQRTENTEQN